MLTLSKSSPTWSKAVTHTATEFSLTTLPILSGKIPEGLRGSLYRNGPARLERGGKSVGHWFDGDGAILAVHFTDAGAKAVYRYVQTEGYQKEAVADRFLFANYGTTVPGPFWNNWVKKVKNAANTSVLALNDKLLALWEGGHPYALDLQTLETRGLDDLSGLVTNEPFSAHPKVDPQTGDIFNFGVISGANSVLKVYRSDFSGKIIKKGSAKLDGLPLVHDFVMAGPYLIFFVPPVRVNLLPVLLGWKSFSDAMQWQPKLGTEVLVFDRHTLSLVSRGRTEPWFQWHFANGYVEENRIKVTFVRYPDFQTNQYLKEVATGHTQTLAKGTLWQVRLDPQTAKVIDGEELVDRGCDFPIVPSHQVGQPWRYTYLSVFPDGVDISRELLGTLACLDHKTGNLSIANMGENCYPSEPIFVPNALNSEQGWVLTIVYDGNRDRSEVRIYDSDRLDDEPLCRLELPSVIPPGFHGTWKA